MFVLNHLTQEPFAVTCNHWLFKSVTSQTFGTRGVKIKGHNCVKLNQPTGRQNRLKNGRSPRYPSGVWIISFSYVHSRYVGRL